MTVSLTLVLIAGALFGCGVTLLLSRSLVRALLGVLLMGNGVNLVFLLASGPPGRTPILTEADKSGVPIGPEGISDPLPQAFVLTAIVITLATTAFTLALAHRSWQIGRTDVVADDVESQRTHERAVANDMSDSDFVSTAEPAPPEGPDTEFIEREGRDVSAEEAEAETEEVPGADDVPAGVGETGPGPEGRP
ncbi:Na(+)/H(+) antiporter subunit C [Granulicoccus phenolivorans]|uniref:Na(+)/H(+) antiporter subunit C n=1 Tax=Granulicoccus phenolivorans TaxID=266854 RepID=UPI0004174C64|nr:Na(+)/H(+) antiporter subunit C [Granulicoccus phenolivorans]